MGKNKTKIVLGENKAIPFDLHYIRTKVSTIKTAQGKFHFMEKYQGEDAILDFYKKNSNIIDVDL